VSRRTSAILAALGVCLLALATGLAIGGARREPPGNDRTPAVARHPPSTTGRSPTPSPGPAAPDVRYPAAGTRRYRFAPGDGGVTGRRGVLLRYQVAVEREISNVDASVVAEFVEGTLADAGGWSAGGRWRFRRVGEARPYDFIVYLVTPATRDALCGHGYDRYTNCREGGRVVLNIERWVHGVPHYGAPLETYRRYMVNHEIGHVLGQWHELCPGRGRPAPVMQQQTLDLHGCVANPWPYLDGRHYRGPAGTYA